MVKRSQSKETEGYNIPRKMVQKDINHSQMMVNFDPPPRRSTEYFSLLQDVKFWAVLDGNFV